MITALEIKPRTSEDFQSHIAYSLGKELKGRIATGTSALVERGKTGGYAQTFFLVIYFGVDRVRSGDPKHRRYKKCGLCGGCIR